MEHATLTLSDPHLGMVVSVRFDRYDSFISTRAQYIWTVSEMIGGRSWSGNDLYGAACDEPNLPAILCSLLSFLSACADSSDGGECADLFPADLRDAIRGAGEVIDMARIDWLGAE